MSDEKDIKTVEVGRCRIEKYGILKVVSHGVWVLGGVAIYTFIINLNTAVQLEIANGHIEWVKILWNCFNNMISAVIGIFSLFVKEFFTKYNIPVEKSQIES